MIDFNINHFLVEEKELVKDPHRFDNFYGTIDEKPASERLLFGMQDQYLNHGRDPKVWSQMFEICWSYIQSIIKKRQRGKNFIEPDVLHDMTTNATLAFMSQYLTKPEFEVGASFAGMMTWKIVEVMYKPSADDRSISLDMAIDDDEKHTLNDLIADKNYFSSPEESTFSEDGILTVLQTLNEATDAINNDFYKSILLNAYMLLCLKHPKNRHSKRMFLSKWAADYKTERFIEYTMLEVQKRLESGD